MSRARSAMQEQKKFVAGAGRGQPYGFRFCESFEFLDLQGAFLVAGAGRATRLRPWVLGKRPVVFGELQTMTRSATFRLQGSLTGRLGQAFGNLIIIFRGRRCTRAQIIRWQALYESANHMICIFPCVFSAKVSVRLDFCGRCRYFVTFRLFSRGRPSTSQS